MAFAKKGQEGLTLTTLLLIVLGIVVVVVVIMGFTTGFDFIFGKIEQVPGQSLETAIQACELAGANNLKADYCTVYRKVDWTDGAERFVTCEWLQSKNVLDVTKILKKACGGLVVDDAGYCQSQKLKEETKVRDFVCLKPTA